MTSSPSSQPSHEVILAPTMQQESTTPPGSSQRPISGSPIDFPVGSAEQKALSPSPSLLPSEFTEFSSSGSSPSRGGRNTLPSGVFNDTTHIPSRNGSDTRMMHIPPPKNYPSPVDGLPRPPTHFVNKHASMLMYPLIGFEAPVGHPNPSHVHLASNGTLNLDSPQRLGHRRNKTTISDMPGNGGSNTPERAALPRLPKREDPDELLTSEQSGVVGKVRRISFASTRTKYRHKEYIPLENDSMTSPLPVGDQARALSQPHRWLSSVDDMLEPVQASNTPESSPPRIGLANSTFANMSLTGLGSQERRTSIDSTDSGSTVASESWNPVGELESPSEQEHVLKRKSSVVDLKTGLRPVVVDPSQLVEHTVRKLYSFDFFVQAGPKRGVAVADFQYLAHHAPVSDAEWDNLQRHTAPKPYWMPHRQQENVPVSGYDTEEDSEAVSDDGTVSGDEEGLLPAISYQPPTQAFRVFAEDAGSIFEYLSDDEVPALMGFAASLRDDIDFAARPGKVSYEDDSERLYGDMYFPTYVAFKLPRTRKRFSNSKPKTHRRASSLNVLRRVSAQLSKLVGRGPAPEPTYTIYDDGLLDREFEFPVREPTKQRVVSEPLLRRSVQTKDSTQAKKHKRHVSLGRWLHKVVGKDEKAGEDDSPRESLLYRRAERMGEFIMRRRW
ncbi:hypothetical protein BKA63DRAFT_491479 [Paraphoma chrysanthemicola]|nr:hypothetical protein BKA63DRAFT_491479 [Paraphoma chrysanthemicola]